KPRELYKFMNVMRDFDEDVWIKHLNQSYESDISYRQTKGVVVSDARQENEIKWLKDNGFTLVKVEAPEALRKQRAKREGDDVTDEQFEHRTEQFVDSVEVDYVINNDGTLDDLYRKIDEVMAKIKSAKGDEELMKFTYASLLSGIRGFEQVIEKLGCECVFASEIDKFASQAY